MDMTLYEIGQAYQYFLEQAGAGEIPEEAIQDTLDGIEGDFREKADNIACMIKNLEYQVSAMKAEEQTLSARRKAKENRVRQLKSYLCENMLAINLKKIETARNLISLRKSPPAIKIEDIPRFIEWAQRNDQDALLTYRDPEPSKTRIKEYLDSGGEIPGVSMEQKQSLQIK